MHGGNGKLSPLAGIAPYPMKVLPGARPTMHISDNELNQELIVVKPQVLSEPRSPTADYQTFMINASQLH
jgi:hypothetical protein